MQTKIFGLLTLALLALPTLAKAAPITWTLQDVQFDDGGTASGSFVIDELTGDMLSWEITTTAGTELPGFTFDDTNSSLFGRDTFGSPNAYTIARDSPFAEPYLNMTFANSLTVAGTVLFTNSFDLGGSWECNNCSELRWVTEGSVTSAVPEPASIVLLGLGLAGLGLNRRRKT